MSWIFFGLAGLLVFGALFVWMKRSLERSIAERFGEAVASANKENIATVLTLARNTLGDESKFVRETALNSERAIQNLVSEIQSQVRNFEQGMRLTEQDRALKFGEVLSVTTRLAVSAEKLGKILSTNNLRGQWGERVAEDILKASGFIEGLHYVKNAQLETNANRPDFTFLLPDEHKVNMDVKFPMANLAKAQEIEDAQEQKRCLKDFELDVRGRIQELTKRDYVNPEESTVDFAILFVPSESVYAAIHAYCADLFEFAEEKRVVLAAPFSLVAILKIILQSFRHFHFEKKTRELVQLIEKLGEDLERFKGRFEDFDGQIKKLQKAYDEIAGASFQKIDSKIRQIERYKLGSQDAPDALAAKSKTS